MIHYKNFLWIFNLKAVVNFQKNFNDEEKK